jgi:hypothetical protein
LDDHDYAFAHGGAEAVVVGLGVGDSSAHDLIFLFS